MINNKYSIPMLILITSLESLFMKVKAQEIEYLEVQEVEYLKLTEEQKEAFSFPKFEEHIHIILFQEVEMNVTRVEDSPIIIDLDLELPDFPVICPPSPMICSPPKDKT